MTRDQFYEALKGVNHSRDSRAKHAALILRQPRYFQLVLDIFFMVDDQASTRAGWLIEFVCRKDLSILYPHLSTFVHYLPTIYLDSAVRPAAKVAEMLALAYYKEEQPLAHKYVTPKHRERLAEIGFDWLITEQKVAVKAYTLTTLYWLGTEFIWIHDALLAQIDLQYASQTAAFKARSRHTREAIHKFRMKKAI